MVTGFKHLVSSLLLAFALASGSGAALAKKPAAKPHHHHKHHHAHKAKKAFIAVAPVKLSHKNPEHMAKLQKAVMRIESSNRRYSEDGKLLTSHRGAMGEMQVMGKTVAKPGYGVIPARNDSPDEYARVGRDYICALMRHYHDNIPLALAAYNRGPNALKRALIKARKHKQAKNWRSYLPLETRRYINKGLAALSPRHVIAAKAKKAKKPAPTQMASVY